MTSSVHFSSKTDLWSTPQRLFDALDRRFAFTLDVCATAENAKCSRYFSPEMDGLAQDWGQGERIWMNPPYGRDIWRWVESAFLAACNGCLVVGLIPARPDTKWWHIYVQGKADVNFFKGRLKFGGAKTSALFPSALAIWCGQDALLTCHEDLPF